MQGSMRLSGWLNMEVRKPIHKLLLPQKGWNSTSHHEAEHAASKLHTLAHIKMVAVLKTAGWHDNLSIWSLPIFSSLSH